MIGEPARSSEQKVPRAASGIDNRQLKESVVRMIGMSVHRMLDHRIEGACEEKLH